MADCNLSALASATTCPLKLPPPGASMSPWVNVTFETSGVSVTVGNNSSPDTDNHAVIKDFEFGHSNGLECRITIIDEQGSNFVDFMEDILKESKCTAAMPFTMVVNFGWVMDGCPAAISTISNPDPYYMSCDNVECNFSGGKFLFQVIGKDIGPRIFEHKAEQQYGTDQNEMHLLDAITTMLTTGTPSLSSVQFLNPTDGTPVMFPEGPRGRLGVWHTNGMDKLNAAITWLSQNVTVNKKTLVPGFNSIVPGGEIIFWEDFKPNCGQNGNWTANCLGTYVVNGGSQSSVIEFSPKIRWNFFTLTSTGGGMGQGQVMANPNGGKSPGRVGCGTLSAAAAPSVGATSSVPVNPDNYNLNGAQSATVAQTGHDAQQKGFTPFGENIEADLVVVGDPTLIRPAEGINSSNVAILFVNPMYINSSNSSCGDWLVTGCNPVLTNNAWIVREIIHRISEGKFTTTFKLYLIAPGIDIDVGQPLGGPGSGGWTPPANC